MKIRMWIEDAETNQVLENLGECVCDNVGRAVQMYQDHEDDWCHKGYAADLCYEIVN